jgi:hypothetical protein
VRRSPLIFFIEPPNRARAKLGEPSDEPRSELGELTRRGLVSSRARFARVGVAAESTRYAIVLGS